MIEVNKKRVNGQYGAIVEIHISAKQKYLMECTGSKEILTGGEFHDYRFAGKYLIPVPLEDTSQGLENRLRDIRLMVRDFLEQNSKYEDQMKTNLEYQS